MNAKENKCNHNLTLNDITLKNNDSNNNNSKTQQNVVLFAIIITTTTRSPGINKTNKCWNYANTNKPREDKW